VGNVSIQKNGINRNSSILESSDKTQLLLNADIKPFMRAKRLPNPMSVMIEGFLTRRFYLDLER